MGEPTKKVGRTAWFWLVFWLPQTRGTNGELTALPTRLIPQKMRYEGAEGFLDWEYPDKTKAKLKVRILKKGKNPKALEQEVRDIKTGKLAPEDQRVFSSAVMKQRQVVKRDQRLDKKLSKASTSASNRSLCGAPAVPFHQGNVAPGLSQRPPFRPIQELLPQQDNSSKSAVPFLQGNVACGAPQALPFQQSQQPASQQIAPQQISNVHSVPFFQDNAVYGSPQLPQFGPIQQSAPQQFVSRYGSLQNPVHHQNPEQPSMNLTVPSETPRRTRKLDCEDIAKNALKHLMPILPSHCSWEVVSCLEAFTDALTSWGSETSEGSLIFTFLQTLSTRVQLLAELNVTTNEQRPEKIEMPQHYLEKEDNKEEIVENIFMRKSEAAIIYARMESTHENNWEKFVSLVLSQIYKGDLKWLSSAGQRGCIGIHKVLRDGLLKKASIMNEDLTEIVFNKYINKLSNNRRASSKKVKLPHYSGHSSKSSPSSPPDPQAQSNSASGEPRKILKSHSVANILGTPSPSSQVAVSGPLCDLQPLVTPQLFPPSQPMADQTPPGSKPQPAMDDRATITPGPFHSMTESPPSMENQQSVELRTESGSGRVVGIDLGTTFSAVAVCRKGRVEMICSDTGSRTTPSVVGFLGGESYVGEAARDLPADCQVFDAKRLIGRPWRDVETQNRKNWPFVVLEHEGAARIRLTVDAVDENFAPEEISGILLRGLKEMAEGFLQEKVSRAVITVPAYFNERQRQATKLAAKIAGLEVMAMINEPTAAAIAYGLDKKSGTASAKKTIFIFDLGGGTFDVSVMTVHGQEFTVLATGGDTHLGGQDFDNRLIDFVKKDVLSTHGISLDSASVQELRKACELAKRKLSSLAEVPLTVYFARHDLGYKKTISRAFFEDLCSDLFKQTIRIAADVLVDSKVARSAVDEVVLVGGSTRIPKVRSLLQDLFGGKDLRNSINPDEAVAYGAAVHAAVLNGDKFFDNLVKLKDVTPLSLGVDIVGGRFSAVIPRNTPIPCERTETYYTVEDNQTSAGFKVYQGERPLVKDNHYLNKQFTVKFPPKRAREVCSVITFSLDCSGLLTVTAVEPTTGMKCKVTVSQEEAKVSEADVQKMLENTERFRKADSVEKRRVEEELRAKGIYI